jgi:folate-binding protein YgfZ
VSDIYRVDLGIPALLEFSGPDALKFLNGQLTQDVRRVVGGKISLPSCVTDAKGKLQFRVTVMEASAGVFRVSSPAGQAENLEARLTRYLIADDVEAVDLTGKYRLSHFTGPMPEPPPSVLSRGANRLGVAGTDWWIPCDLAIEFPVGSLLQGDALEAYRITHGIPAWGHELVEGILPPEARLEESDISYNKGCYIGQEVISRIKSAGKVNKRLTRFRFEEASKVAPGELLDSDGKVVGEVTSVSPLAENGIRHALGYVKRGADDLSFQTTEGGLVSVV